MRHTLRIPKSRHKIHYKYGISYQEKMNPRLGMVSMTLTDGATGELLEQRELKNIITNDAGILVARLLKNSLFPNAAQNNGITMLAVGTGATGSLLSPDAPLATQRKLNSELARKAISSAVFRDSAGNLVSYPTNIVDFTVTFTESEAVGALNEMGLVSTYSLNPSVQNLINNGPTSYDPTIDVSDKDLFANYLTFGVISKPSGAVLSITWRVTC